MQNSIELDTPTMARVMPMKIERWNGFSATNDEKGCLHPTDPPSLRFGAIRPPNALPTSWRCPG